MENLKSFMKRNLRLILAIACGVLVIVGILVLIFLAGSSDGLLKGLFIAFGTVIILIGCALLLFAATLGDVEKANFFLYDNKKKANASVDELDFALVNRKMSFVMTTLASNAAEAWTSDVFSNENEIFADGDDAFVPLVAYKMLYDLGDRANEEVWQSYIAADQSMIDAIAYALEMNNDVDLGKAFKFLHANAEGDYERTQKFLSDNRKYIQNKMVKYVKTNIERF